LPNFQVFWDVSRVDWQMISGRYFLLPSSGSSSSETTRCWTWRKRLIRNVGRLVNSRLETCCFHLHGTAIRGLSVHEDSCSTLLRNTSDNLTGRHVEKSRKFSVFINTAGRTSNLATF